MDQQATSGPGMAGAKIFSPWGFALLLFLGLTATFPAVMAGRESFFYRDYGVLGYPFIHHYREAVWQGEFPLWNPLSNCGAPFLAQWGAMALYPGVVFCLWFPLPWALSYFCLGHLQLAGVGMYFLARRWTGSNFAAAVAGWIFGFNGTTLSCLLWPNYTVALGWMPWVVLLMEQALREGGRAVLLAGLVASFQVLAGVPELTVLTWLAVIVLASGEMVRARGIRFKLAGRLGAVPLLAAGLTAAQILPFLDLLAHSQREAGFTATKWAMPAWGWANLLVPLFHYFETPQGTFFQFGQEFMSSYYPGVTVVVLAVGSALFSRPPRPQILAGLALLSLVLAMGDDGGLYAWLKRLFPALSVARFPVKFVLLASFLFPLLAAFAVSQLETAPVVKWRGRLIGACAAWLIVALLTSLIVWSAYAHPLQYDQPLLTRNNALVRLTFLAVALAGLLLIGHARLGPIARCGLLAVLFLDVTTHIPRQNPSLPVVLETMPLFQAGLWELDQKIPPPRHGSGRVMITPEAEKLLLHSSVEEFDKNWIGKRLALWSNLNLLEQTPKINGSSTLQIRAQKVVEDLLYKSPGYQASDPRFQGLLDFLAVKFISAPGKVVEWTNRATALPLITAGQTPVFLDNSLIPAQLITHSFNPRQTVYLPTEIRPQVTATNRGPAKITESRYSANRITFTVEAPAPSLVVVAQSFYPNWRARVDGQSVPVWRANYAFQAIQVPAGRRAVTLVYDDKSFRLGLVISTITLLGMGIAWLFLRQNNAAKKIAEASPGHEQ